MSSKPYESRAYKPYVQKIKLSNNNKRTRRKPSKLCPDCKDANDYIELLSSKVSKIEEIVDNFKNLPKNKTNNKLSLFNAKFSLNNIPCELEYDLSNFTLENLQKLVISTTSNCKI
ncbi:hypothetical protein RclHR1_04010008 [Rhizophagus clarus]|uniref:Uncharacterized protein n=1 Tax=Rhizophagus clarus TaxID=94130 RepID=A0A2Z6RGA5_9GLOM|nr:hypothetical protein RclHR1_04010008 [Rhizophagus clarus]GES95508.1 hypothetical protein GLOIN_2v1782086 [Rhizophagus clarus]